MSDIIDELHQSCVIERSAEGSQDDYGAPVLTWQTLSTVACRLDSLPVAQAKAGRETAGDKVVGISNFVLYLDYGVDIEINDRVLIGSDRYDVLLTTDPGGEHHHLECSIKLVTVS